MYCCCNWDKILRKWLSWEHLFRDNLCWETHKCKGGCNLLHLFYIYIKYHVCLCRHFGICLHKSIIMQKSWCTYVCTHFLVILRRRWCPYFCFWFGFFVVVKKKKNKSKAVVNCNCVFKKVHLFLWYFVITLRADSKKQPTTIYCLRNSYFNFWLKVFLFWFYFIRMIF